tara:strand:- start:246 stop:428 length:183 start_codon:yes stop_codon:yes gene_type:complete
MNNHLKKLSAKATIDNLKRDLKGVSCVVKKKSIKNLISKWSKVLDSLQLVPVLVPVYVHS